VENIVKIFAELVTESAVPEDLAPTVQGWESLKPIFECLQGQPVFGTFADKYTALGNLDSITKSDPSEPGGTGRRELQHDSASASSIL
jgi:hypothetical protein